MSSFIELTKFNAIQEINEAHADILRDMTGGATVEERDTWVIKAAEAKAFLADPQNTIAPILSAESAITGESIADLAASIQVKTNAYHALVGIASGIRRNAIKDVEAAKTQAGVKDALRGAVQQADAAIAQLKGGT